MEPGVRLHYVEAGQGPLIVLLHRFPEFWFAWRSQIPALAQADVARLLDACAVERASIVGHDWGAIVAWWFAMLYLDRLDRLVILNAPHPATFQRALRSLRQLRKSWYVFFFQLPWLPEYLARRRKYAFIRGAFRGSVHRGRLSPDDLERYVEAIAQPGALTSAINYYRALFRSGLRRLRRIEAPVLVILGERDRYIGRELAEPSRTWVRNARVDRLPDATHWVQNDQPERVNRLLSEFLSSPAGRRSPG